VIRRILLPCVDAFALVVFVVVGVSDHDDGVAVSRFLRNAVPLVGAWFLVAAVTGAYRRPGLRTLLVTWAVAVPAGLLLRTAWVGSPTGSRILVFLGVGLVFTLLFLLVGRGVARAFAAAGAPEGPGVVR
jgi:hypothetical protein